MWRRACAPISDCSSSADAKEFSGPWVVGCDARGEELEAAYVCTWLAEIVCTRQHRPCEGCGHGRLAVGDADEAAREWLRVGDVQHLRAASPASCTSALDPFGAGF
jgi:hypothetical protein